MARIMMQKDRPADAEALLDTMICRTPESLWATEARIEKGRSIQSAHQYIKALNYYIARLLTSIPVRIMLTKP